MVSANHQRQRLRHAIRLNLRSIAECDDLYLAGGRHAQVVSVDECLTDIVGRGTGIDEDGGGVVRESALEFDQRRVDGGGGVGGEVVVLEGVCM